MVGLLLAPIPTWAQSATVAEARLAPLPEGGERSSNDKVMLLQLALARYAAGDLAQAEALARDVIAIDERQTAAWHILIDQARQTDDPERLEALARVPEIFAADAPTLIDLAERLGAPGASDIAPATALRWLTTMAAGAADIHVARELARARLLDSRGHADAALEIVEGLVVSDDRFSPALRRFYAQLLGWTGHHAASLEAYDTYLALMPGDVEARREQARVAGWGQQFTLARRLYDDIEQWVPLDSGAHAEADAKRLFFASRWRDAERAYARWLSVEPLSDEATFEYAETLVAQGRLLEAREVYERLSRPARRHEVASLANRALAEQGAPSAAVDGRYVSSSGYGGQRMLHWSEAGGQVSLPLPGDARQKFELAGSSLLFSNRVVRLPAYAAKAAATAASRWAVLHGAFALVRGARSLAYWQGRAEASLPVRHGLDLRVAVDRSPMLENISTVRDGIMSWGPSLSARFGAPDLEVSATARAGWVASNLEQAANAAVRRRVWRGTSNVWLVGAFTRTAWRAPDVRFFSPLRLTRGDVGAEWMRWLRVPRFRVDRRSSFTMRYLAGIDSDGEVYHAPHAQLSVEQRRVAVDGEVSWTGSRVYRSLSMRLGVRLGS